MRFLTLLLLAFFFANTNLAAFSSLPIQSDCDTILTQKGKTLIVRIVSSDKERVRYSYCGDSSSAVIRFITTKNIKEIRRGKKVEVKVEPEPTPSPSPSIVTTIPPQDTSANVVSTEIPTDAVKVNSEDERIRVKRLSKLAALFSFGTPFLILFAIAFSPLILLLTLPSAILGFIYARKATRATRRRPEFSKYYRLALFSLIFSILMLSIVAVYVLLVLVLILLFILFAF